MTAHDIAARELRVLLKTVTAKDAAITASLLRRAGVESCSCATVAELHAELCDGGGSLLIAEETLSDPAMSGIADTLARQLPWSDLPVLIIAGSGLVSNAVIEAMDMPANITVIERPLRIYALISAVRSALRARKRQYEMRTLLEGLRVADQRKTEFLATLAHELRNPLAPLRTALAVLSMRPHDAQNAQPYYAMMGRQVDHMVRLIDDLMEVSRITRGKVELKTELVDLSRVLQDALESRVGPAGARERQASAAGDAAGGTLPAARRRGAPDAGIREPVEQRGKVYSIRRAHRAGRRTARRACAGACQRQWRRRAARHAGCDLRHVRAGRRQRPRRAGRPRHRLDAGQEPG
jgi:signal transduction histidine kinase